MEKSRSKAETRGSPPRVALVHDWLTGMRGGEKVLEVLCELYPDATLFTLLHNSGAVSRSIEGMKIRTSFIQQLPLRERHYRRYLPLFPTAIERFDVSGYDLVISSSHCVAKGVLAGPSATHICYCHTPMRYVWDRYDDYFGPNQAGFATRLAMSWLAPSLRRWDVESQGRVHHYVANSQYVARRIHKYYGRDAQVMYPPVEIDRFPLSTRDDGYFLVVSALVPYKRVRLAVEAFRALGKRLVVVGTGPEEHALRTSAPGNVEFLGWLSHERLADVYAGCQALVFPGVEDFGIVPLEAMACGKPVIAFADGGAVETVTDSITGVLFNDPSPESLAEATTRLSRSRFDPQAIRAHAETFSRDAFTRRFQDYVATTTGDTLRAGRADTIIDGQSE